MNNNAKQKSIGKAGIMCVNKEYNGCRFWLVANLMVARTKNTLLNRNFPGANRVFAAVFFGQIADSCEVVLGARILSDGIFRSRFRINVMECDLLASHVVDFASYISQTNADRTADVNSFKAIKSPFALPLETWATIEEIFVMRERKCGSIKKSLTVTSFAVVSPWSQVAVPILNGSSLPNTATILLSNL